MWLGTRKQKDSADLLARRKETQKMIAFRLGNLGWTQDEIGKSIGLSQDQAGKFLPLFSRIKKW